VPAGESPGEEPPPGVSDCGWQADRAVMKPSSSITISFDFTVKILTSFTFRLLSYPYSKGGFHFTCKGKDFLAYFTTTKVKCSNILAGIALGLTGVEVRRQLKAKLRNSAIAFT
jgi:hypothetical protein